MLDGAAGAVGFALDLEDDGAIDQAVQEGHGQGWVAQVVAPGVEVDVGGQGRRFFLVAGVEDFVEQIGRFGMFLAFDAVEAEFVNLCGAPHNSINVELAKMWSG
jgi:hypothetical protein